MLQLTIAMIGCILDALCHRIFLQMKEKWTRKNNEDVDEQDARNLLRQKRLCETRLFPENVVEKS